MRKIPGMNSANRKDIALVVILFLLPLVCFADVVFLPNTFYYLDIERLHYPGKIFLMELLKKGQLGFWNPYIFMGFPLLAEPEVGPLYPFNLFFALPIPPYYALTLFIVIHYSLAGVFTYLLARSLGISRAGSFISGRVFAFGGFLMAQLTNISILTGSIWLPLILCLFSQAIRRRSYAFAAGAGVVLALQILPSHPQIILYILITLGLYYFYSLLTLPRVEIGSLLALSLISLTTVAVGMGLAAVQLIPAWQLKELSVLSESGTYDFVTAYSLSPFRMLSFLFPNFLGNLVTGYKGEPYFEEHHGYVGLLPLLLAALAWGRRRNREVRFFGLLALLSVLLAVGNATPLYHLLAYVPVYNYFRTPARWLYTLTLSLGILAGFGLDYLVEQRQARSMRILSQVLLVLTLLSTLTLPLLFFYKRQAMAATDFILEHVYAGMAIYAVRALIRYLPRFPNVPQTNLLAQLFPPLLNPILFFLLMSNASVLLLFFFLRKKIPPRWFQVMAAGLIAFDLFMTGGTTINPVQKASYFDKRPSTALLEQNLGLARIYSPDREGAAPQILRGYFAMIYHIPEIGSWPWVVSSLPLRRYGEFMDALRQNTRLLNLAGVKYILTARAEPEDWWHNNLRQVYSEEGLHIYENLDVMPRAFLVHQAEVPGSDEAILAHLVNNDFDLSSSILLEDAGALARLEKMAGESAPARGPEEVKIVEYEANRVVIEVTATQAGFLFLSDTDYPGWRARVDGQEETVYRADYLFRAVLVPPGHHVVEFIFDPVAFKIGLAVTMTTAATLIAAAIMLRPPLQDELIGCGSSSPFER